MSSTLVLRLSTAPRIVLAVAAVIGLHLGVSQPALAMEIPISKRGDITSLQSIDEPHTILRQTQLDSPRDLLA